MSEGEDNNKIEHPVSKKVHKSDHEEPRNQLAPKEKDQKPENGSRPVRTAASILQSKLKNLKEDKLDENDPEFEEDDEYDEKDDVIDDDGEVTSYHSDVKSEEFDLEDYLKFREADKEEEQANGDNHEDDNEEEEEDDDEEQKEEEKPKKGKKSSNPEPPVKKKRTFEFEEDPK